MPEPTDKHILEINEATAEIEDRAKKLFSLMPEWKIASLSADRAIRFANICDMDELLHTYKEWGEETAGFDPLVDKAKKARKLTDSEIDAIYDAAAAYDDAVTKAVILELITNCKCSLQVARKSKES